MKTVSIKHTYWDTVTDVYLPNGFNSEGKYPAIIGAHSIGSCKEQTSDSMYGTALAKAGFTVIALDASFQRNNGEGLRYLEDSTMRVKDFSIVTDCLTTLPYADIGYIGILGIYDGGRYTISTAMTERRVRAIDAITGANYGRFIRKGFIASNPIGVPKAVAQQETGGVNDARLHVDGLLPSSPGTALEAGLTETDLSEAIEYYRSPRGCASNGVDRSLSSHQTVVMNWGIFHFTKILLAQPLMVVVDDGVGAFGVYYDGCRITGRAASKREEPVMVEGYSHYDLHDKPEPVKQALDRLIPFYKAHS